MVGSPWQEITLHIKRVFPKLVSYLTNAFSNLDGIYSTTSREKQDHFFPAPRMDKVTKFLNLNK